MTQPLYPRENLKRICEYIQRKASHDEFRAALERAMQENAQLIAELANR
jgi:hypothetical protein